MMAEGESALALRAENVMAGYGSARVLFGIDLRLPAGGAMALLGRNGMGKTTFIKTLCGLLPLQAGRLVLFGAEVGAKPAHARARLGLALVPEGRQVFPNLTVRENLIATARTPDAAVKSGSEAAAQGWTLDAVLTLFPELAERLDVMGALLSGGEQQMLAIGRALMTQPRLLVLDEATEGLAPKVRARIHDALRRLVREMGLSLLIVDHDLEALASYCDAFAIMEKGRIAWHGAPQDLRADAALQERHLGLGAA